MIQQARFDSQSGFGFDRLPPHNVDAERAVLGSMLRDNACIDDVVMLLKAESFYLDAHQKIFQAITDLRSKESQPVDLVLLHEELSKRGQLEDVGRGAYIAVLWDAAPTAANVEYYARIVRDKGIVRKLINASSEILHDAYNNGQPTEDLLAKAEKGLLGVSQLGFEGQTYELSALIPEMLQHFDETANGKKTIGLPTGFIDLDELTTGLHPSELVIIGARPSVGKTSFGLAVANSARKRNFNVFFASLEQSRKELAMRLMCMEARVNSHHIRQGKFAAEDMDRILDAVAGLKRGGMYIDDTPSQSALRVAAQARRLHVKHGLGLVVVDYVQIMEPENRRESRYEQIGQCTRKLKALAKELEIPVIALAQVNRASEDRPGSRPKLSDLRESGNIECDADTVMLLHRNEEQSPGTIEVLVEKQRNGPTGIVKLAFRKEWMKFEDYAHGTPYDTTIPD